MIERAIAFVGDLDEFQGTYSEWLTELLIFILDELHIPHVGGDMWYGGRST